MFDAVASLMRTTLDVDEDVLMAVKSLAASRKATAGKVISELARKALLPQRKSVKRNGFTLFRTRDDGVIVTMELVNRLRDEDE
jgi:hypothetical protein